MVGTDGSWAIGRQMVKAQFQYGAACESADAFVMAQVQVSTLPTGSVTKLKWPELLLEDCSCSGNEHPFGNHLLWYCVG